MLATYGNFKSIARLLVDAGADINMRGEQDFDAISLALSKRYSVMAQIIMSSKNFVLKDTES